jgi:hypothetical protein
MNALPLSQRVACSDFPSADHDHLEGFAME